MSLLTPERLYQLLPAIHRFDPAAHLPQAGAHHSAKEADHAQ